MQAQDIPRGYCQCGCGQKTAIPRKSNATRGWIKGVPIRFVRGHQDRGRDWKERFFAKVEKQPHDGCWLWHGTLNRKGYGTFWRGQTMKSAHRLAYELLVGPIPDGLQLDHLCRVRHCVNPTHLEPVTNTENQRRGANVALKSHCKHGHPWIAENWYVVPGSGSRGCRLCRQLYGRAYHLARGQH